jgi:hypothetical protein
MQKQAKSKGLGMPCDYSRYPEDWKTVIRPRILKRAGEKRNAKGEITQEARCEWCGASNRAWKTGDKKRPVYILHSDWPEDNAHLTRIILTIAHIDHDESNCSDDNLAALCQACHLRPEAKQHAENAKATRLRKSGQLLFEL